MIWFLIVFWWIFAIAVLILASIAVTANYPATSPSFSLKFLDADTNKDLENNAQNIAVCTF